MCSQKDLALLPISEISRKEKSFIELRLEIQNHLLVYINHRSEFRKMKLWGSSVIPDINNKEGKYFRNIVICFSILGTFYKRNALPPGKYDMKQKWEICGTLI